MCASLTESSLLWLVAYVAPSHYRNQWCLIVNWTLVHDLQLSNWMKYFLFAKMHFKFPFANLWPFFQPQGVNTNNSDICLYQPLLVSWKGSNNFNRRWANYLYVYLTNYTHCSWWLLWQLDYHTIVPVPVKPPWIIWANETHGDDWKTDYITTPPPPKKKKKKRRKRSNRCFQTDFALWKLRIAAKGHTCSMIRYTTECEKVFLNQIHNHLLLKLRSG